MRANDYPFVLTTAVSIDLADSEEILDLMVKAGFDRVTVGIESPDEKSLAECQKFQNHGRDLLASVQKIQKHGLEVQGGFIVGFDNDSATVCERQIDFIQESGIATAMVSLLFAFPETRLYHRLEREERLSSITIENNAYGALNFVPKMGREVLIEAHKQILETIYSPRYYFERVKTFLNVYRPYRQRRDKIKLDHIKVFLKAVWILGVRDIGRQYYWKLLAFTLRNCPRSFPIAVRLAVTGYHFRNDIKEYLGRSNLISPV
jgi:radical SAM superfamily enzyme YgiQ (UPF0313 family)